MHDIQLVFSGWRTFILALKSVETSRIDWQHTGQYDIVGDRITFHLKRGDELYGKIVNDIMTISNWYELFTHTRAVDKTFELKKQ